MTDNYTLPDALVERMAEAWDAEMYRSTGRRLCLGTVSQCLRTALAALPLGEIVATLKAADECVEGLHADFLGCTDNAQDPDRLHEWDGTLRPRFAWVNEIDGLLKQLEGGE